jgi:hypothetical protein
MAGELKNIKYYQIIPYHGLAKVKYDALGAEFAGRFTTPPPERVRELEEIASRYITVFNPDHGMKARKES